MMFHTKQQNTSHTRSSANTLTRGYLLGRKQLLIHHSPPSFPEGPVHSRLLLIPQADTWLFLQCTIHAELHLFQLLSPLCHNNSEF